MLKVIVDRRCDWKQGKGRNRSATRYSFNADSRSAAIAEVQAIAQAGREIAPGYAPIISIDIYQADSWLDAVRNGRECLPVISYRGAQLSALVGIEGQTA